MRDGTNTYEAKLYKKNVQPIFGVAEFCTRGPFENILGPHSVAGDKSKLFCTSCILPFSDQTERRETGSKYAKVHDADCYEISTSAN